MNMENLRSIMKVLRKQGDQVNWREVNNDTRAAQRREEAAKILGGQIAAAKALLGR